MQIPAAVWQPVLANPRKLPTFSQKFAFERGRKIGPIIATQSRQLTQCVSVDRAALKQGLQIDAARQRAEVTARAGGEATSAKRFGNGSRAGAGAGCLQQYGALQRARGLLDQIAGVQLKVAAVVERGAQFAHVGVKAAVEPDAAAEFFEQRIARLRFACQRAQYVEADDVARAFPDRIDWAVAEVAAKRALFDKAAAAEAFHGFVGDRRCDLADVVFGDGRGDACEWAAVCSGGPSAVVMGAGFVPGPADAERDGGGSFGLELQIGETLRISGLSISRPPNAAR